MADQSIKISLELADAAANRALSNFIAQGGKADDSMKKLGQSGSGAFADIHLGIGKALTQFDVFAAQVGANVLGAAFDLAKESAHKLFDVFIVEGVKAANEAEDALHSLNVAMAQSGIYSEKASKGFEEFAAELQKTTAFSDDVIIKNAALLETMTGLSENGLKRATKAAIELSAAYGIDLQTATQAIAKAHEGQATALRKLGLNFDQTGSKANVYESALAAIESRLSGSAESKLNTFSGAIARASNYFNDLQESTGGFITRNAAVLQAVNAITDIFGELKTVLDSGDKGFKTLVGEGLVTFIETVKIAVQAVDFFQRGFRIAFNLATGVVYDLVSVLTLIPKFFSSTMKEVFEASKAASKDAAKAIDSAFDKGNFDAITESLNKVGFAAKNGLGKITDEAEPAKQKIDNLTGGIKKLTDEQIRSQEEINNYVKDLAKQGDSTKTFYDRQIEQLDLFNQAVKLTDTDADQVNFDLKLERQNEYYIQKQQLLDQNLLDEQARIDSSNLDPDTKYKAQLEAQARYNIASEKLGVEHAKTEKEVSDDRVKAQRDTFNSIATLATSNNRTLATIGKAAAITTATIDGYAAVQKALAAFPPPFNFVAAALVGAATAANVANIAGVQFEQGGIVPGASYTGDLVQARVNSGEMVLNRQQQAQLFAQANGKSSNSESVTRSDVAEMLNRVLSAPFNIVIDGKEIFNVMRQQTASGRAY